MSDIATKLTYLNTTKGKIKDSINLTGAGITTEPFRQYAVKLKDAYVDIINNGTDTLYNNFPKVSGSGTDLSLQNTYEAPMRSTLKGNTSQNGTPTPSSPIPINNVSGNNSIVVCGKNLFDKDNATILNLYVDGGVLKESSYNKLLYIPCKPNTTYTLQKIASPNTRQLAYTKELPSLNVNAYGVVDISTNGTTGTITTGNDAKYLVCRFYQTTQDASTSLDNMKNSIQIEYGNQATTYEAYNGTTYPINLPNGMELCKIGTYQDYIYKENDKWYLHKEIGKVVLNGSESGWNYQSRGNNVYRGYITISNGSTSTGREIALSNYFYAKGGLVESSGNIFINSSQVFLYTNITTIEAFKTWLSTHNTSVYYVLATPTNTEITDTTLISQLEAIYNAKSKNGTTNINQENNDLPFIITASALEKEQ